MERDRLLWLILKDLWRKNKLSKEGRLLHVAPEPCLEKRLREHFDYISADLDPKIAMIKMDLTAIQCADDSFDAIVCNHVLEHIPDDNKAIAEVFRVLKPGGWASIQVPIKGNLTLEDPEVSDPQERRRLYGQTDHVRQYGKDFRNRLERAGFSVWVLTKTALFSPEVLKAVAVECEDEVWISLKESVSGLESLRNGAGA